MAGLILTGGAMKDIMRRMKNVYHATGGTRWIEELENAQETKDMTPFDAQKYLIVKKIKATREVCRLCCFFVEFP